MPSFRQLSLFVLTFLITPFLFAHDWEDHQKDISDLECGIYKLTQELDTLVEKKKNTREQARIEQTLQRIVEIHAELISLRKSMDNTREHLKVDHPQYAHILDDYDSRMKNIQKGKARSRSSLTKHLDDLLIKVQLKFASFVNDPNQKAEVMAVDASIQKKKKARREREADVYLRRRSKVKLVK